MSSLSQTFFMLFVVLKATVILRFFSSFFTMTGSTFVSSVTINLVSSLDGPVNPVSYTHLDVYKRQVTNYEMNL